MGVCFMTRRLNVVPETHDINEIQTAQIEVPDKVAETTKENAKSAAEDIKSGTPTK